MQVVTSPLEKVSKADYYQASIIVISLCLLEEAITNDAAWSDSSLIKSLATLLLKAVFGDVH
mgnify:CR=1 FL=1